MAIQRITPRVKTVVTERGQKSGAGLGQLLGAAAGVGLAAASGGASLPLTAALGAAGAGSSLGGLIGNAIQPGRAREQFQEASQQAPLTASEEAIRSQELLSGIRAAQDTPGFGTYATPLTKAYVQSMVNLKRRG